MFFPEIARPFRAKLRRGFATVQDPPVRRYGGLRDQDRIFTNAYCRHDHGIKGAMVCFSFYVLLLGDHSPAFRRPEVTGTGQKIFSPRVIPGSFRPSRILVSVEGVVLGFRVV